MPSSITGNKDTLDTIPKSKGINTRDELLKFHSQYYSSNIMSLAVLGKGNVRGYYEIFCSQIISFSIYFMWNPRTMDVYHWVRFTWDLIGSLWFSRELGRIVWDGAASVYSSWEQVCRHSLLVRGSLRPWAYQGVCLCTSHCTIVVLIVACHKQNSWFVFYFVENILLCACEGFTELVRVMDDTRPVWLLRLKCKNC